MTLLTMCPDHHLLHEPSRPPGVEAERRGLEGDRGNISAAHGRRKWLHGCRARARLFLQICIIARYILAHWII